MGRSDHFKLGDWNAVCDICGFKYKASQLKRRWDGLLVCSKDFEYRQPQDFVKGVRDNQSVPFSRPEAPDQFIPYHYDLNLVDGVLYPGTITVGLILGSFSGPNSINSLPFNKGAINASLILPAYNYTAVGTDGTAMLFPTTLNAEVGRAQNTFVVTPTSVIITSYFPAGVGTGIIQEAGIFDASSGGDILARQTFNPITKDPADTLTITWTIHTVAVQGAFYAGAYDHSSFFIG